MNRETYNKLCPRCKGIVRELIKREMYSECCFLLEQDMLRDKPAHREVAYEF